MFNFTAMLRVEELHIYPIKSIGGLSVQSAQVLATGLEHDRLMMLVDGNNRFLSQREMPALALLHPAFDKEGLRIVHKKQPDRSVVIPFRPEGRQTLRVTVWDDHCEALLFDQSVHDWFSAVLGTSCRLVYLPETTHRLVHDVHAGGADITSFSDGFPLLLAGCAALDDLNRRLDEPVPMNRFRPNIVFSGGEPFLEDRLDSFSIGPVRLRAVKPCARCVITTINQDNGTSSREPLKTLAAYRTKNNKVMFGQNLLTSGEGRINVGDELSDLVFHNYSA